MLNSSSIKLHTSVPSQYTPVPSSHFCAHACRQLQLVTSETLKCCRFKACGLPIKKPVTRYDLHGNFVENVEDRHKQIQLLHAKYGKYHSFWAGMRSGSCCLTTCLQASSNLTSRYEKHRLAIDFRSFKVHPAYPSYPWSTDPFTYTWLMHHQCHRHHAKMHHSQ